MNQTIDLSGATDECPSACDQPLLYTIVQLLAEGKLHFANQRGTPNPEAYIEIRSILSNTDRGEESVRWVRHADQKTVDVMKDGQVINTLTFTELEALLQDLEAELSDDTRSVTVASTSCDALLSRLTLNAPNASALRQGELSVEATDRFGTTQTLHFQLLSEVGAGSMLLAPSEATNFCFKAEGLTDEVAQRLNKIPSLQEWLRGILSHAEVVFEGIDSQKFHAKLAFIDTQLDQMLASALIHYYRGDAHRISDLVELVAKANPCQLPDVGLYQRKFKACLSNLAWGKRLEQHDAPTGLIVLKEDGAVMGFLPHDPQSLEAYIFERAQFEIPSRNRHHYGALFKKADGAWYFNLNLQVRFMGKAKA